jgi:hypothetical protein
MQPEIGLISIDSEVYSLKVWNVKAFKNYKTKSNEKPATRNC